MDIKTKHNIGEEVFFMHNNKIETMVITRMDIYVSSEPMKVICRGDLIKSMSKIEGISMLEHMFFKTKEELIATL